jgi:hypothetical protein
MPDSAYALYLQSPERIATFTDATLAARWGALARTREISSSLATEAGANAVAAAIGAFLGGPLSQEVVTVKGVFDVAAYRGRCHAFNGVTMFVLGGDSDRDRGVTTFSCLRKL